MRVHSFYRKGLELEPVEIEVTLMPGIPTFNVTGLPDTATKESVLRLKAALRSQGFELPKSQQVLFHLRPAHERKSSHGLDLALAAAYLWKTEQLPPVHAANDGRVFLYGELTLNGEVKTPDDLQLLESLPARDILITGNGDATVSRGVIDELRGLQDILWQEGEFTAPELEIDHSYDHVQFSSVAAEQMAVAAIGEHNVFIAGPAGSGKSTFARALHACLRDLSPQEWRKLEKVEQWSHTRLNSFGEAQTKFKKSRPLMTPHHTATEIALIGGGVPPQSGEITRAQHGVLLLDEFLKFDPYVVECLREPIESHEITLLRRGVKVTFPADFMLVATTNICPCGAYTPRFSPTCQRTQINCRSYFQKLSGPLIDRFEAVVFSHYWSCDKSTATKDVCVADIRDRVRDAQDFIRSERGQTKLNSRLSAAEIEATIKPFVLNNMMPELPTSHRRRLSLLRVARSYADLDLSPQILSKHIDAAATLTLRPHTDIRDAFC